MPEVSDRKGLRKKRIGIVLSDKMQKTIVVQIRRKALHPFYGKVIEKAVKFKVHDEKNIAKIGDRVSIAETRPISKDKRWRLVEVLKRATKAVQDEIKNPLEKKAVQAPGARKNKEVSS